MATVLYDPSKSTWFNPNIEYLFDDEIIEYDMRDAGYSLICQYDLLPAEKIHELAAMGKGEARHKAVGLLQRDKEFSKALLDKFAEMRQIFISSNNLVDDQIVTVKKDAIFTVGRCKKRKFGLVEFSQKNRYSSYVRLSTIKPIIEFYYSSSQLDVKGMGDIAVNTHRLFLITFIQNVISKIEMKNIQALRRYLIKFINDYKSGELDEEFYLEFNNLSRNPNPLHNWQHLIIPLTQIALKEMD